MADTRQTVWAGEQGSSAKFLTMERDLMKGLGQFISDLQGSTNSFFTGLACTPGTGLQVVLGPGAVYQTLPIDPSIWSTLAADTSPWPLQAIVPPATSVNVNLSPPSLSAGQSVNILVECQLQVTDTATVDTKFYNSSNPASPIHNSVSPSRKNVLVVRTKNGTPATTGSQTTPAVDSGWIPLYAVTVDQGESSLVSGDIALAPSAPAFFGFVPVNPSGNTPVFLSPGSPQAGFINITGVITAGASLTLNDTSNAPQMLLQASGTTKASFTWNGGVNNWLVLSVGTGPALIKFKSDGSVDTSNGHAGTDGDPYAQSKINADMLGGKVAADYALASGNYLVLYAGAPTIDGTHINGGLAGQLTMSVATGTAPFVISSTTLCANLNADLHDGFQAGNSSGNIPVSNGTLNTNLNAQFLNGLPSSAFQPAGTYAVMGSPNTGNFQATGSIASTGGTGSNQVLLNYAASNGFGINGGNQVGYIQSPTYPLGLVASSVRTNCPLYVGDATRQNLYCQDVVPSGVVRSGLPTYRVTRIPYSANHAPFPVGSPGAVDVGYWVSPSGNITLALPGQFSFDYRMVITLNAGLTVNFNGRFNDDFAVWVDGVVKYNGVSEGISASIALLSGQHTIDIIYGADGSAGDDHLDLFGWLPWPGGQLSSTIVSVIPG